MATITGTAGNDSLTGTSGNDSILGLDGNDTIAAGAGNDTISGNVGVDWVEGGLGNDQVSGGSGQDSFVLREAGASNADVLFDFASTWDNIQLDAAVFADIGASGRFASGDARFYAAAGATAGHDADDRIIFNTTTREIFYDADGNGGGAAQLIATLPAGRSVVASDFWVFGTPPAQPGGTPGNDSLTGTSGNDTIDGLAGNDTIRGLAGNDSLVGGDGNDILDGGTGTDTMVGGLHDDLFIVDNAGDVVVEQNGGGNNDEVRSSIQYSLPSWVNNLTLTSATAFSGTGNELDNIIRIETGHLLVDGADGNDTLLGGAGGDRFAFEAGSGNYGNDSVDGGAGDDNLWFTGAYSAVTVDFFAGSATGGGTGGSGSVVFVNIEGAVGSAFGDRFTANDNGLGLRGRGGNDTLIGGAGNDFLAGDGDALTAGADQMFGFGGNDTFIGGAGADLMQGGDGADLFGLFDAGGSGPSYGNDTIDGGAGVDTLSLIMNSTRSATQVDLGAGTLSGGDLGGGGSATLSSIENVEGDSWSERIKGSASANFLIGNMGQDTLDGAGGNDTLIGGGNGDHYVFSVAPGLANADQINGFAAGVDKIVLDGNAHANIGASGNFTAGDERFHAGATAQETDDRVIYDSATGQLWYDADGSDGGVAQLIATVQPGTSLAATDIAVSGGSGGSHIVGTNGDDDLFGTPGNDTIDGLGGNDWINGGDGANLLIGGAGNDTLWGTGVFAEDPPFPNETMDGGMGDDWYVVDTGDTILADPGGVDTVETDSDWTLGAGLDNLQFNVEGGTRTTGIGNELPNLIVGGFYGGSFFGMGGNDRLITDDAGPSDAHGGDGDDTLEGGLNDDALFGDAGNDVLSDDGAGNNSMTGGTGADTFKLVLPSPGSTAVTDFQSGVDKIRLDATNMPALGVSGNFSAGDERFHAGASAQESDDRVIYDSAGRLWYDADGSGAGGAQLIVTLSGAPTLVATDIAVDNGSASGGSTINGTAGNDSLVGTSGNDTINGLAGNDTLRGLEGDDLLDGGDGVDSLDGGLGNDTYVVSAGDVIAADAGGIDTVRTAGTWNIGSAGTIENVTVTGMANTDTYGNNLANVISGNDANNYIDARGGSDTIVGNGGNDYIEMAMGGSGSFGQDSIDGGAGVDTLDFDPGAQSGLVVDLAAGTVSGGEAGGAGSMTVLNVEKLIGGGFADRISGNAAANSFSGGGGNDTLAGAGGADTLTGGVGADSFVFAETAGSANADRITDFAAGTDELLFQNSVFMALGAEGAWAAGDGRFHAAAGATAAAAADDRLVYNTSNGNLYYDADGAGGAAAQLVATLANLPALSASDITVI